MPFTELLRIFHPSFQLGTACVAASSLYTDFAFVEMVDRGLVQVAKVFERRLSDFESDRIILLAGEEMCASYCGILLFHIFEDDAACDSLLSVSDRDSALPMRVICPCEFRSIRRRTFKAAGIHIRPQGDRYDESIKMWLRPQILDLGMDYFEV